jgi:hypothetical protein
LADCSAGKMCDLALGISRKGGEPPSRAFDLWQVDEANLDTGIEKL